MRSIAGKLGIGATETLRKWVRQAEIDHGDSEGVTTAERERIRELEREVSELRRANEILRKASAYFAQAELSSTAHEGDGRVHRRSPRRLRSRVDLRGVADRSVDVFRGQGPPA